MPLDAVILERTPKALFIGSILIAASNFFLSLYLISKISKISVKEVKKQNLNDISDKMAALKLATLTIKKSSYSRLVTF